jgi:hypothetical protein
MLQKHILDDSQKKSEKNQYIFIFAASLIAGDPIANQGQFFAQPFYLRAPCTSWTIQSDGCHGVKSSLNLLAGLIMDLGF